MDINGLYVVVSTGDEKANKETACGGHTQTYLKNRFLDFPAKGG